MQLDNQLLSKAMRLGGFNTEVEAVNSALSEYVQRREQLKVLDLFGTVDFDSSYDYKKRRKLK